MTVESNMLPEESKTHTPVWFADWSIPIEYAAGIGPQYDTLSP